MWWLFPTLILCCLVIFLCGCLEWLYVPQEDDLSPRRGTFSRTNELLWSPDMLTESSSWEEIWNEFVFLSRRWFSFHAWLSYQRNTKSCFLSVWFFFRVCVCVCVFVCLLLFFFFVCLFVCLFVCFLFVCLFCFVLGLFVAVLFFFWGGGVLLLSPPPSPF